MIKSQVTIAKELGISKQAVNQWTRSKPLPKFFKKVKGVYKIDTAHPSWESWKTKMVLTEALKAPRDEMRKRKKSKSLREELQEIVPEHEHKLLIKVFGVYPGFEKHLETALKNLSQNKDVVNLEEFARQAARADMEKSIYDAEIKKEKSIQAHLQTLEIQKELAPVGLLKHYFSFAEELAHRLYNIPHEVSPQLAAFFLAKEDTKAVNFLKARLETAVRESQEELLKDLKSAKVALTRKKLK